MRKGIDGLRGIIRDEFHADPTDGSLFVFVNRQRDRMKLLHFESSGFWMYCRVLEAGTFEALRVVIIGLIVGGVMMRQDLIDRVKLRKVISEVKKT